eukprot:jgi/Ulvmu1/3896/UM018_0117.1
MYDGWVLAAAALCACMSVVSAQALDKYDIGRPLTVCTASIQNFGARCNGSPAPEFQHEREPIGPVPENGWCAAGEDFCGYDVDVWSNVAERMGLKETKDYVRVCLGEGGFSYMIDSLAGENSTYGVCDIGVSSITASTEREARGITFSRATFRSGLAILVHAPLMQRGMWAFFDPLHYYVWIALVVTIIVIPFFVFFFEAVFAKWTAYMRGESLEIANGLVQCLWHSVSHTLSIDVFHVRSMPARIITAAYAFLVLILTNTYTANLAAFLTVTQLDTPMSNVADLRGKTVATVEPYLERLYRNHHIIASTSDGWDYDVMISKLRRGDYAAVISDDTQLISRAYSDDACSLHILGDTIEPFDLAIAFNRNFPSDAFRFAVSSTLLDLQEGGVLSEILEDHKPPEPQCVVEATEFSETNQVAISSLWGLWVILAMAVVLAAIAGAFEYVQKRQKQHEDADKMRQRAAAFRTALPGATSLSRVTAAFWTTIDKSKRQSSANAGGAVATAAGASAVASAPPPTKAQGALWTRAARASKDQEVGAAGSAGGPAAGTAGTSHRKNNLAAAYSVGGSIEATPSGRPSFVPLMPLCSLPTSEVLDVFTCPPSVALPAHAPSAAAAGDGALGGPLARARASRTGSANSRHPFSRQTSHNSVDPSLGVHSTACRSEAGRSDTLDPAPDMHDAPRAHAAHDVHAEDLDGLRNSAHDVTDSGLLRGLPLACMDGDDMAMPHSMATGVVGTAAVPTDLMAGTFGLSNDLDSELEELNLIVQAVAQRVSVLLRTRQQERQKSRLQ